MAAEAPEGSLVPGDFVEALAPGDIVEVEWPCQEEGASEVRHLWLRATVAEVDAAAAARPKFLLRFADGGESWNSLRKLAWRRLGAAAPEPGVALGAPPAAPPDPKEASEQADASGFVHCFEVDEELLRFCDELHERRDELGDKTRGDAYNGEKLAGGLVSVVVRREALLARERDFYMRLHQRCVDEVPRAWPEWLRKAAGRTARARPSQDLRLLQYSEGANFKAHVDSGWACQALIYLNEDFRGGQTEFPNLAAWYRPRRGRALLWRSVCVGHKAAVPGSLDDHPALHVAGKVSEGVKRVVSINLVLA